MHFFIIILCLLFAPEARADSQVLPEARLVGQVKHHGHRYKMAIEPGSGVVEAMSGKRSQDAWLVDSNGRRVGIGRITVNQRNADITVGDNNANLLQKQGKQIKPFGVDLPGGRIIIR